MKTTKQNKTDSIPALADALDHFFSEYSTGEIIIYSTEIIKGSIILNKMNMAGKFSLERMALISCALTQLFVNLQQIREEESK